MVNKYKDNTQLMTQCYDIAKDMDISDMFAMLNNLSIVTLLKQIMNDFNIIRIL